jgi:hypothetical protein
VLADGPPPPASPADADGFRPPPPKPRARSASPVVADEKQAAEGSASPTASGEANPLAALLGYDDAGDCPRAAGHLRLPTAPDSQPTPERATSGDGAGAKPHGQAGSMDAELASFLSELESSGLLADDDAASADAQNPQRDAQQPTAGDPAATAHTAGQDARGGGAAASAGGGATEQKVLGPVEGAGGGWFLVLDSGSGRQYYWHRDSNEVAWTLPAGAELPPSTQAAGRAAAAGATSQAAPASEPGEQQHAASPQPDQRGVSAVGLDEQQGAPQEQPAASGPLAAFLTRPAAHVLEAAERIAAECSDAAAELLDQVPKVGRGASPPLADASSPRSFRRRGAPAAGPVGTSAAHRSPLPPAKPAGGAPGCGGAGPVCPAALAGPNAAGCRGVRGCCGGAEVERLPGDHARGARRSGGPAACAACSQRRASPA